MVPLALAGVPVAAPQAYALVGMAGVLAGICRVPLTAILLLFELTHDYRIIVPLMGTVGVSSLVASAAERKMSMMSASVAQGTKSALDSLRGLLRRGRRAGQGQQRSGAGTSHARRRRGGMRGGG